MQADNRFDLSHALSHIGVLRIDLKRSQQLYLLIPSFLVDHGVANVTQSSVLPLFFLIGHGFLVHAVPVLRSSACGLDLDEVQKVLGVGFALQPQLVFLHRQCFQSKLYLYCSDNNTHSSDIVEIGGFGLLGLLGSAPDVAVGEDAGVLVSALTQEARHHSASVLAGTRSEQVGLLVFVLAPVDLFLVIEGLKLRKLSREVDQLVGALLLQKLHFLFLFHVPSLLPGLWDFFVAANIIGFRKLQNFGHHEIIIPFALEEGLRRSHEHLVELREGKVGQRRARSPGVVEGFEGGNGCYDVLLKFRVKTV